jgi:hypothetical protein
MGYKLEAFILSHEAAEMLPHNLRHLHRFRLDDQLTLIPSTRQLYKEVLETFGKAEGDPHDDTFHRLHPALGRIAAGISSASPVLYLEVDVASGIGDHTAVVWHQGKAAYGPTWGSSHVNKAFDLFGQLGGLPPDWSGGLEIFRHRFTGDWVRHLENDDDS